MKKISTIILAIAIAFSSCCDKTKVKNVILMIPDGTSLSAVSAARWYQRYKDPEKIHLNIDPYLCGTILTYCSNAPIGDSAPTTSCYMNGTPSLMDWVSTYPVSYPGKDLIPLDSTKAYQPLMTALEATRITQKRATGLVFTCEFPHATPADCAAHSYRRGFYNWIAPQMVHNDLDVVIGGGAGLLTDEYAEYLRNEGCGVFRNEIDSFRNYQGDKMWALFNDKDMALEMDRKPELEPSLAEMTKVAISKLSKNKNGFFLMVEGSKVDWAAHSNDTKAVITDFLAFDEACGVALDFARRDGNTTVIIVPDHGNSGISIGRDNLKDYAKAPIDTIFKSIDNYKVSVEKIVKTIKKSQPEEIPAFFLEATGITLSDSLYKEILKCGDYKLSSISDEQRMRGTTLTKTVAKILSDQTYFGYTTHGHTGEEVFLAIYDPKDNRLTGNHTNIDLNYYIREKLGIPESLETLTDRYFAKHSDIFGESARIDTTVNWVDRWIYNVDAVLTVEENGHKLEARPNTNIVKLDGKDVRLNSVVIYVDKTNSFYLPRSVAELLKK